MPVAIPMAALPKSSRQIAVITVERLIFTILFAIRMVFSKSSFFSRSFELLIACLCLLSLSKRKRKVFMDEKADSDAEKTIERKMRTPKKIKSPINQSEERELVCIALGSVFF